MYQGKYHQKGRYPQKRRKHNRKPLLLLASLVLIFALATTGTLAWLITNTGAVQNTMVPAEVPITIHETFDGTTKSGVTVQNTGNTDTYIRVAIIANAVDDDGNVIAGTAPNVPVDPENWTKIGNYYYYNGIVTPNGSTARLFNGEVTVTGGEINILAESIQALGGYNGQAPENYAWGVTYNDGVWS